METEKMRGQMSKEKQIRRFMWMLLLLSCAIFFLNYDERVLPYNSTILAFSYKYGFISRGLAGTIYQWLDAILPVNLIAYDMVLRFTLIVTIAFYALFFAFCYQCMKRCEGKYLGRVQYLILFYAVFVVSMFAYKTKFRAIGSVSHGIYGNGRYVPDRAKSRMAYNPIFYYLRYVSPGLCLYVL